MNTFHPSVIPAASSLLCALSLAIASPAFAKPDSSVDARALLEEAKKSAHEKKIARKQTELDRLNEDLTKGKQHCDELKRSVEKVEGAISDTTMQFEKLMSEKKRASQDLELINLRIEAAKLKVEGLKLLESANSKALDALAKRNDETELQTTISMMEMRGIAIIEPVEIIASGPEPRSSKGGPSLSDMRKKLEKAARATYSANTLAREAMATASERLQQAERAAEKADKKESEIGTERNPGFPGGNDPLKP